MKRALSDEAVGGDVVVDEPSVLGCGEPCARHDARDGAAQADHRQPDDRL